MNFFSDITKNAQFIRFAVLGTVMKTVAKAIVKNWIPQKLVQLVVDYCVILKKVY